VSSGPAARGRTRPRRTQVVDALANAGCVAPEAEADVLFRASRDGVGDLDELVTRRCDGEPLAWIVGSVEFLGLRLRIDPGVFVPRSHTELLAARAIELTPPDGIAVDLCTGCGAVAAAIRAARPRAAVHATDLDPVAVACARRNDVPALVGDLDEPLPASLDGRVDVVTAVVPYVPSEELHLLPRDVVAHEPRSVLDGGPGGTSVLRRAAAVAARRLRPGGTVLLELGGDQAAAISETLEDLGLSPVGVHRDEDGLDRAIEARRRPSA
jgi:release factor glutamine methyltransferase